MIRNRIALIWLAGLVLAVLLTVVGPGQLGIALDRTLQGVSMALQRLGEPVRAMIRAFAIAAYVVFIALCVVARRRGLPSMGAALLVTLLFLLLAGEPREWGMSLYRSHWLLALLLAGVAALAMTRRLTAGSSRRP